MTNWGTGRAGFRVDFSKVCNSACIPLSRRHEHEKPGWFYAIIHSSSSVTGGVRLPYQ